MKRLLIAASVLALAACSQAEAPAPEATATAEPAATTAAAPLAADGKPTPGNFKITTADGKIVMEEVKADGTYSDTIDGKVVETGKWVQKSPAEYCYTADGEGAKEVCNKEAVDANGVWTSTNPEGKTATVERVGG